MTFVEDIVTQDDTGGPLIPDEVVYDPAAEDRADVTFPTIDSRPGGSDSGMLKFPVPV